MSKKEKIVIRRDDDLVDIDDELEVAMQALDGANQRIVNLLSTMEPIKPVPELAAEGEDAAPGASAESEQQTPEAN
ncbi:MAG: hypothetical protein K1Y02_09350 [Candidatus Hydrogenedentes bacterium]|nr:hypothetical protein [Candidatus Hydrogenedentota bacterium]